MHTGRIIPMSTVASIASKSSADNASQQSAVELTPEIVVAVLRALQIEHDGCILESSHVDGHLACGGRDLVAASIARRVLHTIESDQAMLGFFQSYTGQLIKEPSVYWCARRDAKAAVRECEEELQKCNKDLRELNETGSKDGKEYWFYRDYVEICAKEIAIALHREAPSLADDFLRELRTHVAKMIAEQSGTTPATKLATKKRGGRRAA
jgi:plasmid stabilization system protein ParE